MTARPCLDCGAPSAGTRCPECSRQQQRDVPRDHVASINNSRWKRLSQRLRRAAPHCEACNAITELTVDHIVPVADVPELAYAQENCRVLCRTCNGRRGNRHTDSEIHEVLRRLQSSYDRRPYRTTRNRINALLRHAQSREGRTQHRGVGVDRHDHRSTVSRGADYTPRPEAR